MKRCLKKTAPYLRWARQTTATGGAGVVLAAEVVVTALAVLVAPMLHLPPGAEDLDLAGAGSGEFGGGLVALLLAEQVPLGGREAVSRGAPRRARGRRRLVVALLGGGLVGGGLVGAWARRCAAAPT